MIFPILTVVVVGRVGWSVGMSAVIVPALIVSGLMLLRLPRRVDGAETEMAIGGGAAGAV
jgi:hypothetical protein